MATRIKIIVCCREEIERGLLMREPYVLISIRDPDKPRVKAKKNGLCRAMLCVAFHDAEPSASMKLPAGIQLMTNEDAEAIWQFVNEHRDRVGAVVIHCEQGMSRSPAVAAGIAIGLNGDPSKFLQAYQPNQFVLSLVKARFCSRTEV